MRFLYKIYSRYDGFRPAETPRRMREGRLQLGWRHYIDAVEKGWECWIYFHGPHRFESGVYANGIVDGIDLEEREVTLRVRNYNTVSPITSPDVSRRIAHLVAPRRRQVFVWPDDWNVAPQCSPGACRRRRCEDCATWTYLRRVPPGHSRAPSRLRSPHYQAVVPAYWFEPRRCHYRDIGGDIGLLSARFTAFKLGEMAYAYPFALAIFEQLRTRDLIDFDCIVPIPLSPDKAGNGEQHRTLALAEELRRLLAVPVRDALRLTRNISKRQMRANGYTRAQFERAYRDAFQAEIPPAAEWILLVDDVMTHGSRSPLRSASSMPRVQPPGSSWPPPGK